MRSSQIILVSLISLTLGTRLGFSQVAESQQQPGSEAERLAKTVEQSSTQIEKVVVDVSAPQKKKPAEMVLVKEGDLFQVYRPQNAMELRAAAQKEAARQAEIKQEKLRLVEQLIGEQAKAENLQGVKITAAQ